MGLYQILLVMDQGNLLIESQIHQISFEVCYSVRMFLFMLVLCLKLFLLFISSVSDSMEYIEKDYVLVNANSTLIETLSYHLETSPQIRSTTRASTCDPKQNEQDITDMQTKETGKEPVASSVGVIESSQNHGSVLLPTSCGRLHLLHQYVQVLSELSQEKVCLL